MFGNIGTWFGEVATLGAAAIAYLLAVYLFYGIASLAFRRHTFSLWAAAIGAVVFGYLFSGLSNVWSLLTGWSMLLFGGAVAGRLNIAPKRQLTIYLLGCGIVAFFVIAQFTPIWPDMIKVSTEASQKVLANGRENLIAMGYNAEAAEEKVELVGKILYVVVRLIPATSILSALLQFSVAYLVFLSRLDKQFTETRRLVPFHLWKAPFGLTPVVLAALLARYLGNETFVLAADNTLAVLAVFYCVTGLALVEYLFRKLRLSKMVRILFYLMLFFAQLAGFFAAALLGFIDSFADWRKVQQVKAA
jgi:uncharacterized protein YybS (DUF2232 family)